MALTVTLDIVVVAWLLWRQLKVRRVWPRLTLRLAVVLGIIGLIELLDYTNSHRVSGEATAILALSFLVGAVTLGAVRAATVKIWRMGPLVLRQGTWVTVGLWLVSIGLHYGAQAWINSINGPSGLISASLLLWLAVTYGVQNAVVHHRAEGLLAQGAADGPVAGRWWAGRWVGADGPGAGWPGGWPPAEQPTGGNPGVIDATSEPVDTPGTPGDDPSSGHRPA